MEVPREMHLLILGLRYKKLAISPTRILKSVPCVQC